MKIIMLIFLISVSSKAGESCGRWEYRWEKTNEATTKIIFSDIKTGKEISSWESPDEQSMIQEPECIRVVNKTFLYSRWLHGEHSETGRIFDPLNRPKVVVYEGVKAAYLGCKVKKNILRIMYKKEMEDHSFEDGEVKVLEVK